MFNEITCDDVYRLETARLWLRWPRAADAPQIARLAGEKAVAEMTGRIRHPYPAEDAERFVLETRANNSLGKSLGLIITPKQRPNDVLGAIGLAETPDPKTVEIGYWIGVPYWRKGYASEAVLAVVDTGFELSDATRIEARVRTANPASRQVLENNGFSYIRGETLFMPAREASYPVHWLGLARADWSARKAGASALIRPSPEWSKVALPA
ncbi:MAG: GNAT family N-acetyltransferase [Hyphomicrobiales bacterium]